MSALTKKSLRDRERNEVVRESLKAFYPPLHQNGGVNALTDEDAEEALLSLDVSAVIVSLQAIATNQPLTGKGKAKSRAAELLLHEIRQSDPDRFVVIDAFNKTPLFSETSKSSIAQLCLHMDKWQNDKTFPRRFVCNGYEFTVKRSK